MRSMNSSKFLEAVAQLLECFEREEDQYLIQVYSEQHLGYEWMPVTEEVIELLCLIEGTIHGEE